MCETTRPSLLPAVGRAQIEWSGLCGFVAYDFVSLNQRSNPLSSADIRTVFHPHDFTDCPYENFCAAGDFRRQCHGEVQFGAGTQIIFYNKIDATGGDVARLPAMGVLFHR